jgi:general L-amino acid transport system permease protein
MRLKLPTLPTDLSTWTAYLYDPKVRAAIFQILLLIALLVLGYEIVTNTAENLRKQNIASGFGFLGRTSGFDVSQTLIDYNSKSTYARAFWVGLINTLIVASLGIVIATVLGFVIGLARLSSNWLVSRLALTYVETVRNIPLLLQLLVWYVGVLRALPMPQNSWPLGFGSTFDVRGLHMPAFIFGDGASWAAIAFLVGSAAAIALERWARKRREATGQPFPVLASCAALVVGLPLLIFALAGFPLTLEYPTLGRFNFEGGFTIEPEFMALLAGLSTYTAAFIAEIVRSGVAAVPRGQTEAAMALGLNRRDMLRLVIVPQAMRIIIPPLTNQYLNLTKNSSLATAIGYPDLVSVFAGTVLNLTGQAVEVILITMGVYLTLSLLTALAMNWFNARMALVER